MSSTCSLPNSPSSSTCKHQPRAGEADLFSNYSPRAAANFKKPSVKPDSKTWKAVLVHLAPRRLSLPPINSRSQQHCVSSTALPSSSSSSGSASDIPRGFHSGSYVDFRTPLSETTSIENQYVAIGNDNNLLTECNSFPFSFDVANDVEKLLRIFRETPILHDHSNKRTLTLGALCALCVSSPNHINRCVRAGGVQTIIHTLDSTAQPNQPPFPDSAARPSHVPTAPASDQVVEETEKALLLLQLLTTSEEGCIAALQHCSRIVAALSKKLLRVSETCTASAIAILSALCRRDATLFHTAVSETAIPGNLVVVLQVAAEDATKRRAARLLRLLAGTPTSST